jgi:hypothetical protein
VRTERPDGDLPAPLRRYATLLRAHASALPRTTSNETPMPTSTTSSTPTPTDTPTATPPGSVVRLHANTSDSKHTDDDKHASDADNTDDDEPTSSDDEESDDSDDLVIAITDNAAQANLENAFATMLDVGTVRIARKMHEDRVKMDVSVLRRSVVCARVSHVTHRTTRRCCWLAVSQHRARRRRYHNCAISCRPPPTSSAGSHCD